MGETTCLMHGFSYVSPTPFEAKEGNPIHALGESVSFGRFMSESLSWEKWSTFSHKKYVEEAAQYSKPGSVAQKKAFFEAYYKRKAMLEQANAEANSVQESQVECIDHNVDSVLESQVECIDHNVDSVQESQVECIDHCVDSVQESQAECIDHNVNSVQEHKVESVDQNLAADAAENLRRVVSELGGIIEQQEVKAPYENKHLVFDGHELVLNVATDELATSKAEEDGWLSGSSVVMETLSQTGDVDYYGEAASLNVENRIEDAEMELSEENEMEKPLLQDIRTNQEELESTSKKKPETSSLNPLLAQSKQLPKVQCSTSWRRAAINPRKETVKPAKMDIEKDSLDRLKSKKNSPARCRAAIDHPRKENATPIKMDIGKDSLDRLKSEKNSPARCRATIDHPRKDKATPIKMDIGKDSLDRLKSEKNSPARCRATIDHPRKDKATPIKMDIGKDSLYRLKSEKNSPARCRATIEHPRKETATPIKMNTGKDSFDKMKAGKYSPARCVAALNHPSKENVTPIKMNTGKDSFDRIKASPRPLHMYMNVTPSRDPNKPASRAMWNLGPSRVPVCSLKPPNCKSPWKTPAAACTTKKSAATPQSENRRTTPILPSASGSRSIGAKWRSLALDFSKSLSACRNKLRSPIISSPFSLRTEERAARRKEKLEEKFNEKVVHKVQLQTTLKDKAESELKKLRQSLCFKARPLPDFYKERKTTNRKDPAIPQSPKLKRESNITTDQTRPSLPPQRPFPKSNSSKHPLQNKVQSQIRPRSLADMISHQNTSTPPNVS